jgi:hypothetical protein
VAEGIPDEVVGRFDTNRMDGTTPPNGYDPTRVVSRQRLAMIAPLTSVALVVGLAVLNVSPIAAAPGPKSRHGDPAPQASVTLQEQYHLPPNPIESMTSASAKGRAHPTQ